MEQEPKQNPSNIERLVEELSGTNQYLRHAFSLRMIILRGLVTGVAIVVGSTVFAGLLFSLIGLIFGDLPFVPSGY